MTAFQIYPLRTLDEMVPVVDLQRTYWGEEDGALVPSHMLFSLAAHGGHVLAATDGNGLAGMVMGILGSEAVESGLPAAECLYIYSKRMVVSQKYRNQGLGSRLKFAQREYSLGQGITKVVWTFDPMLTPNAHLNLHKLGGMSRSYREDYYGTTTAGLSPDGTSDRLYLEWMLNDEGVAARAAGEWVDKSLADYQDAGAVLVNPATFDNGQALPGEILDDDAELILVETPTNYVVLLDEQPSLARTWRLHSRDTLGTRIKAGYAVRDFVSQVADGVRRGYYVLQR